MNILLVTANRPLALSLGYTIGHGTNHSLIHIPPLLFIDQVNALKETGWKIDLRRTSSGLESAHVVFVDSLVQPSPGFTLAQEVINGIFAPNATNAIGNRVIGLLTPEHQPYLKRHVGLLPEQLVPYQGGRYGFDGEEMFLGALDQIEAEYAEPVAEHIAA